MNKELEHYHKSIKENYYHQVITEESSEQSRWNERFVGVIGIFSRAYNLTSMDAMPYHLHFHEDTSAFPIWKKLYCSN